MSQEVSVRGTGGAVFAGILLIIAGVLWMLQGLAGIVKGTSTSRARITGSLRAPVPGDGYTWSVASSLSRRVSASFRERLGRAGWESSSPPSRCL